MKWFHTWGYYEYNGKKYLEQSGVYDAAVEAGDPSPTPQFLWPLHEGPIDEPELSLDELYANRARELREKYDHVTLMFSGGHDSVQMLAAFTENNIFIDEVVCSYPFTLMQRLPNFVMLDDPLSTLYEFRFSAVPKLKQLAVNSPNTKITLWDTTPALTTNLDGWHESFPGPRISGGLHGLHNGLKKVWELNQAQRRADELKGRKICQVYGVEKPYLRLVGHELFLYFTDIGRVGLQNLTQHGDDILYDPILFYWGDPFIPVKQAHVIKRALEASPKARLHVRANGGIVGVDKDIPGIDHYLIYPNWDGSYQGAKSQQWGAFMRWFVGPPAEAAARVRNEFFNRRYARLTNVCRFQMNTRVRVGFTGTPTKSRSLGFLKEA